MCVMLNTNLVVMDLILEKGTLVSNITKGVEVTLNHPQ